MREGLADFSQQYGVAPDVRTALYASTWLREYEHHDAPPPTMPFWYREPGLWLPLSCAIGFDAGTDLGEVTATSLTAQHTVSGANPVLVVCVGSSADDITGVTYNTDPMDFVNSEPRGDGWFVSTFLLANPDTGSAFDVVISAGSSITMIGMAASYTGCAQSGQPDNKGDRAETGTGTYNHSLTPIADNCWVVFSVVSTVGTSAGVGTTTRASGDSTVTISDNDAAITPPASTQLQRTGSSGDWCSNMLSLAPFVSEGVSWLPQQQVVRGRTWGAVPSGMTPPDQPE